LPACGSWTQHIMPPRCCFVHPPRFPSAPVVDPKAEKVRALIPAGKNAQPTKAAKEGVEVIELDDIDVIADSDGEEVEITMSIFPDDYEAYI
jgi:hypothetical protein